jgi:hypothetical protein
VELLFAARLRQDHGQNGLGLHYLTALVASAPQLKLRGAKSVKSRRLLEPDDDFLRFGRLISECKGGAKIQMVALDTLRRVGG